MRIIRLCIVQSLILVLCLSVSSRAAQDSFPQNARVDSIFSRFNSTTPGCALGVARDGVLVYARGFGMASLELGVPITSRTVFDIGSESKQITAAAIVLLAQQGKLSLDDDVRKFVPELPDYGQVISLRHLLHHISGLRDYLVLLRLAGAESESVIGESDILGILIRQRGLNFLPGDDYLYSNSNYFLLALVVKRVSGMLLRQFADENIFTPLGMKDTQIVDDHTHVIMGKAASYAPQSEGGFRTFIANWEQPGPGGVQTTVEDLAKWDRNFYYPTVGGTALVRELQTPGELNDGTKLTYALGLVVDQYRGLRRVTHTGSWEGFRTFLLRFPDQRLSVIVPCNTADANPNQLAQAVADTYLDSQYAPESQPEGGKPTTALEQAAGTYYSAQTLSVRRFSARDGKLYESTDPLRPLLSAGSDQYIVSGGAKVRFENNGMSLIPTSGRTESFERLAEKPSTSNLASLAGDYWNDEIPLHVRLIAGVGKLIWHVPGNPLGLRFHDVDLLPVASNLFSNDALVLQFDKARGATGFRLGDGRARGMRFIRIKGLVENATCLWYCVK